MSGGADDGLWFWDLVARRELRCLAGHRDRLCCLCFGPDGRSVLSSALDQTVRLWDIDVGSRAAPGTCCAAGSPRTGRVISGGEDGSVRLWPLGD